MEESSKGWFPHNRPDRLKECINDPGYYVETILQSLRRIEVSGAMTVVKKELCSIQAIGQSSNIMCDHKETTPGDQDDSDDGNVYQDTLFLDQNSYQFFSDFQNGVGSAYFITTLLYME